jgi:hypothetical protein
LSGRKLQSGLARAGFSCSPLRSKPGFQSLGYQSGDSDEVDQHSAVMPIKVPG